MRKKKRNFLRPISDKHREEMKRYMPIRNQHLKENPQCAVYPSLPATQIHHTRGKLGELRFDRRGFRSVSLKGHIWIDNHPEEARKRGLLCERGLWHVPFESTIEQPT